MHFSYQQYKFQESQAKMTTPEQTHQKKQTEEDNLSCLSLEKKEEFALPSQKIMGIIKELDKGSGAFIEEIIERSPLEETEKIIEKMLESGEIFKNMPGKIKAL